MTESDILVEVRDLKVHFPIKRGLIFDRTIGHVKAVDGVDLSIPRGEDVRPGRRVRLRQVDARPGAAPAHPAHRAARSVFDGVELTQAVRREAAHACAAGCR